MNTTLQEAIAIPENNHKAMCDGLKLEVKRNPRKYYSAN